MIHFVPDQLQDCEGKIKAATGLNSESLFDYKLFDF